MGKKVAFITGASRGIGAVTAVRLAQAGYDLALTARTLQEGERHEHGSWQSRTDPLPGSLESTAQKAGEFGARVGLYRSDILEPETVLAAADLALADFGRIDVLINNACYQGLGNLQRIMQVTAEQAQSVYRGNVLTPLLLVQKLLPGMEERGSGAIINMVSGAALVAPPAPGDEGGWGFAYAASKAALIRMVPSLRVEHRDSGIRFFGVEPGFVLSEVMRAEGLDENIAARFNATPAEHIAEVIHWLIESGEALEWQEEDVIHAPALYQEKLAGSEEMR